MNHLLGRLLCSLPKWMGGGHKRGQLTQFIADGSRATYVCPRCFATWERKIPLSRQPKPAEPQPIPQSIRRSEHESR